MTTDRSQSTPPDPDFDPALLARLAADGELSPAQAGALERLSDSPGSMTSERVAFEHALRDSVARVMGDAPPAPDALRERVLRALHENPEQPASDPIPFRPNEHARPSSHAGPFRLGWILAAAAMVAVTALVLWMPNPSGPNALGPGGQRGSILPAATAERLVSFLDTNHDKCANFGDIFKQKMFARTNAEAAKAAIEILHKVPDVLSFPDPRLSELGYEFAGLGRCGVPGTGQSAHLIYRSVVVIEAPAISLFVQEDTGELPLDGTCCYCAGLCKDGKKKITVWRREGIVYYLVTPASLHDKAREAFRAPHAQQPLI